MATEKCMCDSLKIFFFFTKWVAILPLESYGSNHSKTGCKFRVWKNRFWLIILYLIIFFAYSVWTVSSYILIPSNKKSFLMYTQFVTMAGYNIEIYIDLFFNNILIKQLGKLFERLSLSLSKDDLKTIKKNLTILVLCQISVTVCATMLWATGILLGYPIFTPFFLTCALGYFSIIYTRAIHFAQTISIVMLCLIVIVKFEQVSKITQQYLNDMTRFSNNKEEITLIQTFNLNDDKMKNVSSIIDLHIHMCEVRQYLSDINKYVGFQLFYAFCFQLVASIHLLFRALTSNKYNAGIFVEIYAFISLISFVVFIVFFTILGHLINKKGNRPLEILQTANLVNLSFYQQQQVQTLLQQWMSFEPAYLSAFSVVRLGPWLFAPVISSIITYLLVFLQYDTLQIK